MLVSPALLLMPLWRLPVALFHFKTTSITRSTKTTPSIHEHFQLWATLGARSSVGWYQVPPARGTSGHCFNYFLASSWSLLAKGKTQGVLLVIKLL